MPHMIRLDAFDIEHRCNAPQGLEPLGTRNPEASEGSSPADVDEDSQLVGSTAMNAAAEFYAQQRAEQAEKERQEMAYFDGLCAGKSGAPRVNRCSTTAYAAHWDRGFDDGQRAAALERIKTNAYTDQERVA